MPVFSSTIPEVPEGLRDKDYVITFDSSNGSYALYTEIKTVTVGEEIDNLSATKGSYAYISEYTKWEYMSSGGIGAVARYPVCRSDTVSVVYSTYDLKTTDGSVYFYSGYNNAYVFNDCISSSTILTTLKNQVFPLVSLVAVAIVLFFGFRKAWSFISSAVRGA